jgi:hypothetical protein
MVDAVKGEMRNMKRSFDTGKQKGMANIIYIMGLILMTTISLSYIVPFISQQPDTSVVDIAINNNVFLMRDSLDMAKVYIDNSALFSIYQSLYDSGKAGGFSGFEDGESIEHHGIRYSLWYNNKDMAIDESGMIEAMEESFSHNFKKYTEGKMFRGLFLIGVPAYDKISISNWNGVGLRLQASASADLSVRETVEGGDDILVEKSSDIDLNISLPYFLLFEEAMDFHDFLHEPFEDRMDDCIKADIERSIDRPGFTLISTVLDANDGSCMVRVEAETKKSYPVWNGSESVLDKIRLVFMERMGPEQCRLCISSGSLQVQCREECDEDEYPSITVFRDMEECIRALDDAEADFSDDEHFSASRPQSDMLVVSQITGIPVDELLLGFTEGHVEAEHTPPMSRLSTIPGPGGEFRVVCIPGGECRKMFCELKGTYYECSYLDSPQSRMLNERDKDFVLMEEIEFRDASRDCEGEPIPCGPWSIFHALKQLGVQASPCEINDKRKPGLLSLRRFLSVLSEDAMQITWPDQLVSIIESYGLDVERRTGSDEELRRIAIEEAEKPGKAVIVRLSLDERNKMLSQHYEHVRKNPDGEYMYLDVYQRPMQEIYIISKAAA